MASHSGPEGIGGGGACRNGPPAAAVAERPAAVADGVAHPSSSSPAELLRAYLDEPLPYTVDDWPRLECEGCQSNKRYYCPTCVRIIGAPPQAHVPRLTLPIRVDLVLADYPKKSTGIQAAVVAPGSIHVHAFPDAIPGDWDAGKTLVVFPAPGAVTLDALAPGDLAGVERFVLLDSRWNNTTRVLEHPSIARLTRKVQLRDPPRESRFWRYHSKGEGHLSSVEALYYLLKEYEALTGRRTTDGATAGGGLEGLFFLFRLQLRVIQEHYDRDERKRGMPLPMEEAGKARLREMRVLQGAAKKEAKRQRSQAEAEARRQHQAGEGEGQEGQGVQQVEQSPVR